MEKEMVIEQINKDKQEVTEFDIIESMLNAIEDIKKHGISESKMQLFIRCVHVCIVDFIIKLISVAFVTTAIVVLLSKIVSTMPNLENKANMPLASIENELIIDTEENEIIDTTEK